MTTKTNTTKTGTTKKFVASKATKPEFDREVKRLASAKCLAGKEIEALKKAKKPVPEELQAKYDKILAEYDKVRQARAKKFPGRKTYMDMTAEEIKQADLKTCVAAIASLHSMKSRYPHRTEEALKKMSQFNARRDELNATAEAKEVLKNMSKEQIEALLASK